MKPHDDDSDRSGDHALGMDRPITRRDFLNGVAMGIGGTLSAGVLAGVPGFDAISAFQGAAGDYPPALTGMRGSHEGSFEVSQRCATADSGRPPVSRSQPAKATIWLSSAAASADCRPRISTAPELRPREFSSSTITTISEGTPSGTSSGRAAGCGLRTVARRASNRRSFSTEAQSLMTALGVDPVALSKDAGKAANRAVFEGLRGSTFFDKETFGADRLVVGTPGRGGATRAAWEEFLAKTPLSTAAQADIGRLETSAVDYMPGLSDAEKKDRLSRISYKDFLLKFVKVDPSVIPFYQVRTHGLYGIGIDAVGALECWASHYPRFEGMHLDPATTGRMSFTARGDATPKPDYDFHFPDGNASIARLLVRALVPGALPGHTAEDSVLATVDYAALDRPQSPVRIRLSSTVARVRHVGDLGSAKEVEVSYGREKKVFAVRAKGVVLACWNMMIPYLCPELPPGQQEALKYGVKVPLVYTSVALRNWQAFKKLGINGATTPGMYHTGVRLEMPTVIGGYDPTPASPDDPILVRMTRTPCKPGLPAREQQRAGHVDLLTTPFRTFERNIRDQLVRVLGDGGFDPARDIDAITVNRWPHGYAYEYNPLWDPDWPPGRSPCEIGRKPFGRITIANSDAAAAAYTDQAIDQAFRAVGELGRVT